MSFRELYIYSYVKKMGAGKAGSFANTTDKLVAVGNEVYIFGSSMLPGE